MRKGCLSARPRYHSFRHKPAVAVDRRPSSLWRRSIRCHT